MQEFLERSISGIGLNDVLDILIVTFIIYKLLQFISETRAQQLIKGLAIIIAVYFAADFFKLYTISWILKGTFTIGIFALIVVFQPEIRRALEVIGRTHFKGHAKGELDKDRIKYVVDEITDAVDSFSKTKTGALIVFERETVLKDISETGTIIQAEVSQELLGNLFYVGSPLHDGAVIIRDDRILAAGCVLPLTENKNLNKSLGTRHRAGIGITENSDCLTVIVSEETGVISVAENGKLERFLNRKSLQKILLDLYLNEGGDQSLDRIFDRIGGKKKDAEE
ncbi:MAG: diadenylate cyclase CdaA [Eubacterium sp.]|nr:diadenylate cyclase CdaA [Eubacterium sp.]